MPGIKKILIVDDDMPIRLMLRRFIEKLNLGHVIFEAEDGDSAFKMYQETSPDLIITDFEMPNMNGSELAVLIRNAHDETTKIILHSGSLYMISRPDYFNYILSKGSPLVVFEFLGDYLSRAI